MWKFLVCFMIVLPAVLALNFNKCSKLPPPDLIRTSYCKSLPCKLVRGQEIKADISFKNLPSSTTKLSPKVTGSVFGMEKKIPIPELQKNVCGFVVGTQCPLEADARTTWRLTLPIPKSLSTIKADLKVKLVDQDGKTVICFKLPIVIV
ncbi:unnamed protein product [Diamesa tonsa]